MVSNWIPVKYGLPKEAGYYLVYIHQPDDPEAGRMFLDENDQPIDFSFVYLAYFNVKQGGIWHSDCDEYYNGDLNKVDKKNDYYISHWMSLPDKPNEGE